MTHSSSAALAWSARIWFTIAVIGQLIFTAYITLFHGPVILGGDPTQVNKLLPNGYVEGNPLANAMLGAHLALAAFITLSGAVQLIPQIRNRYPIFHRWLGRTYIASAYIMAISGLYLVLSGRKVIGDTSQQVAICINSILILLFATLAWRSAMARRFAMHRRWALSLFLTVSGVWFFRVGLMAWLAIHRAPVGFDPKTFTGPFLTALAFGQYLLPLAVLELYLRARTPALSVFTAAVLFALTLATALGIFAATMGMWLPRIPR